MTCLYSAIFVCQKGIMSRMKYIAKLWLTHQHFWILQQKQIKIFRYIPYSFNYIHPYYMGSLASRKCFNFNPC